MMYDAIKNFHTQFSFRPKIENAKLFVPPSRAVVVGMGGSHLAADLFSLFRPGADIRVHRNYGLPEFSPDEWRGRLVVLSSYSGNTEEVLDALNAARVRGIPVLAVATGGKLLDFARLLGLPYVLIPSTSIQPRMALGYMLKALCAVFGYRDLSRELTHLRRTFVPLHYRGAGRLLAERLKGHVPVIYASERNAALAYNWKIKFNETAKIPAFINVLPELNHNEMTGFDAREETRALSRHFTFLFLRDLSDHPRILRRFAVLQTLYEKRGFPVHVLSLEKGNFLRAAFTSLITADWTAYYTARLYGAESEQIPMVEEFKKLI